MFMLLNPKFFVGCYHLVGLGVTKVPMPKGTRG